MLAFSGIPVIITTLTKGNHMIIFYIAIIFSTLLIINFYGEF